MREVNISQLWGRTWYLFKGNWLLLVGPLLLFIAQFIIAYRWESDIGMLMAMILAPPVLVRMGYLGARKGQYSFREDFGDLSPLLKVLIYQFILALIPWSFIVLGHLFMVLRDLLGVILVLVGYHLLFISYLFGWAGPYAILSGRAGIFSAIGPSISLTIQNFGQVFPALLSLIGLVVVGWLPCGLGFLLVLPIGSIFLPLLYFALTGEEGASHA
jgi:uncharacterized membrane protein